MVNLEAKALAAKRQYHWLNELILDTSISRALRNYSEASDQSLTLVGCLLGIDVPEPFPPRPTLAALNSNLERLQSAITKPGQLRKKLINPDQFLNTISELALARTLLDDGYDLTIEYEFAERRDVDIFAHKLGRELYIDATNLCSRSMRSTEIVAGAVSEVFDDDRIVEKIVTKFREKFEGPLQRGWVGHPWGALDVAKDDLEKIRSAFQRIFRDSWQTEIRNLLQKECPALEGALIYLSDATVTHVQIIGCIESAAR